jgi:hypothetical protein
MDPFLRKGLLFLLLSCSQKNENPPAATKTEMRTYSELSGLMLGVQAYQKVLRDSVQSGAFQLPDNPMYLSRLHSAKATDSRELKGNYHELADRFIQWNDSVHSGVKTRRIEAFNKSIDACIQCHSSRCPGPISSIRKLYLPVSDSAS